jgi:hypothetical protein
MTKSEELYNTTYARTTHFTVQSPSEAASKEFPASYGIRRSQTCLRKPTTESYPQPDETSPHSYAYNAL